tara:strand:+ start:1223 stop:1846 length:624 start_codon:yes stop_codon:yes gene_type:complete
MISVRPGGFQIPMTREQPIKIQSRNGNSGNGGRPSVPTLIPQQPGSFPRVNLNPQFRLGGYNNAEKSFSFPIFNEYWKNQFNTNNPINPQGFGTTTGLKMGFAGHSNNGSSNYKLAPGAGYNVKSWEGSHSYNRNSENLPGIINYVWTDGMNLNSGQESQVLPGNIVNDQNSGMIGGAIPGSVIGNKQKQKESEQYSYVTDAARSRV